MGNRGDSASKGKQKNALSALWQLLLAGLALFIFYLAIKALYRLTKTIEPEAVLAAIANIPTSHLWFAGFVVAFGYAILTLYDVIAIRQLTTCRRSEPPKQTFASIALTSFTAYAISHTVGANIITASGIRYRHYSRRGLTSGDIANIVWMVSMAFSFGIATLLGLSLTLHPEVTVQLLSQLEKSAGFFEQVGSVRAVGIGLLGLLAVILGLAGKQGRHLVLRGWRFDLPPASVIIQQIIIAILDLSTVALVLYLLIPAETNVSYWATLSAFIQSMAIGIISHVPGGLGVFEVTMMGALPQVEATELLAVLLVFRLLYYIMPFLLAVGLLIGYEIWLFSRQRQKN